MAHCDSTKSVVVGFTKFVEKLREREPVTHVPTQWQNDKYEGFNQYYKSRVCTRDIESAIRGNDRKTIVALFG